LFHGKNTLNHQDDRPGALGLRISFVTRRNPGNILASRAK
jgi:hypothetical protein